MKKAYHIAIWVERTDDEDAPIMLRDALLDMADQLGIEVDYSDFQSEEHEFPSEYYEVEDEL